MKIFNPTVIRWKGCVCATENWIAGDAPLNTLTKLQDSHGEIPVFGLFGSACTSDCHSVRIISFPEKYVSLLSIWKLPFPKIRSPSPPVITFFPISEFSYKLIRFLLTLDSGIDVPPGINVAPPLKNFHIRILIHF